ncbi:FtsB family cell division protein [Mordavella massiliensis]|uniref:Septum formation initiator family protein n=1 Tax=Mordavella massiliensis TaxID=1871024 RepID=A0A939BF86_9CLOT|nr:septum formation initiator family protein [Mordavella massiliensis]MBM6947168.1 septum formation initiator family protein [Mordavella massiliensis]
MGSIRQKSRARRRKKQVQQHRRSMLGISAVILLLAVMVTVSSVELRAKNNAYIEQEQELEADIQAEKERAEEISDLEEYVGTDEYVEQQAKDRLGLVHENEIIFKAK